MVGLVLVAHSVALAQGLRELVAQMAPDVVVALAGGDDEDGIGTSMEKVTAALDEADAGDGVVVLGDLGSAKMTAELALELLDPDQRQRVVLAEAPLVEGAVSAATTAQGGADLTTVLESLPGPAGAGGPSGGEPEKSDVERSETLPNPLGLHARPAAAMVRALAGLNAEVVVAHGDRTASARSVLGLVNLAAGQGAVVALAGSGPDADEAVGRLAAMVRDGFGETADADSGAEPGAVEEPTATRPHGVLRGVPAVPGLAVGPVARLRRQPVTVPDGPADDEAGERARLDAARAQVAAALAGGGDILEAQRLLLDDPELAAAVNESLASGATAARAWADAVEAQRARLAALNSSVLAARAADVEDVGRRVLGVLLDVPVEPSAPAGAVVVATDVVPSQVPALVELGVAGLAVATGGPNSHAAILARAAGLPTVVGLGPGLEQVADGVVVLVDGANGTLRPDPSPQESERARREVEVAREQRRAALAAAREPARLADGTRVHVLANVRNAVEARAAVAAGADGVGLLRTEFMFDDRAQAPDEQEQVSALRAVLDVLGDRPVVVRTLDVGGDKPAAALGIDTEHHGVLGQRGVRVSLARPDLFRTQLRALLRAAAGRRMRVMFPFVTTREEFGEAREALAAARESLDAQDVEAGHLEGVGMMIEVPAAALDAHALALEADFFSVGSNDLVALTMAADRDDGSVAHLYRPDHPAVLRLVERACAGAAASGRPVAVCGEMAADPDLAAVLVGLGVRELSMAPGAIPAVKARLRRLDLAEARVLAGEAVHG